MRRFFFVVACAVATIVPSSLPAVATCSPVPLQPCSSATPSPAPKASSPAKARAASNQPDTVDMERQFFELVNGERAKKGMGRLSYNGKLTDVARRHSADMASSGELRHNDAELRSSDFDREMGHPTMVGENVGDGESVTWLHDAFMNSEAHRSNILESRYTSIGIGVSYRDNTVWVTEDFIRGGNSRSHASFPVHAIGHPRAAADTSGTAPATAAFHVIVPVHETPAAAAARVIQAVRAHRPSVSALKLPPIPDLGPSGETPAKRTRPLLPLAVLATLSAVAFASRRDAGAYI